MSYQSPDELNAQAEDLLKDIQGKELKNKDRLKIPLQEMPAQDPDIRRNNMSEVALGYSEAQVKVEAERCLQCKNAPCVKGCPVGIDIPGFIKHAATGDFSESARVLMATNLLPAVCGRVCPQEKQCQEHCTVGKSLKDMEKSVSIGRIERYVADWQREHVTDKKIDIDSDTGKKVAIIGCGPAGLTAAADLRKRGHEVVIFEAFHKPGGVMVYGIPEFRLPKAIVDAEVHLLVEMGVEIRTNFLVGRTRKLKDLLEADGFDAAFIGVGAGLPKFLGVEGENLVGVFSANEYLTRANLMKAYELHKADTPMFHSRKVAVLGGGNVAMDAARTAMRLGAEEVNVIYRRSEKEMPARLEEVEHAKEEGIKFHFLKNVKKILGNDEGHVDCIETISYELGEPDASGRRRPVEIEGSEDFMQMDTVITAIGSASNPLISKTTPELDVTQWGNIIVNENGRSSIKNVFAGGDIVTGAATVIEAMGAGRIAADAIHEMLSK